MSHLTQYLLVVIAVIDFAVAFPTLSKSICDQGSRQTKSIVALGSKLMKSITALGASSVECISPIRLHFLLLGLANLALAIVTDR